MAAVQAPLPRGAVTSRWIARVLGTALFVLFAKQGWYEIHHLLGRQQISDHALSAGIVVMLIGVVLAWFLEGAGSVLILAGYCLATVPAVAVALTGTPAVWILSVSLVPFLITGILYRRAWSLSRRRS